MCSRGARIKHRYSKTVNRVIYRGQGIFIPFVCILQKA
ncbi:hypothetical protein F469_02068 [Pseudomonas sp. URMO17WK12:I2]|nr:hypothetical protein F469_02068 [Pseudomonas sp. URMO17WK12:I2]